MVLKTDRHVSRTSSYPDIRLAMKLSLIISLLFHVCVLLAIQKAFPMSWTRPLRTYRVELIRPALNSSDDNEKKTSDFSAPKSFSKTHLAVAEDTISLDTKDKRYSSYAGVIKNRLMSQWIYPKRAWENLVEGEVLALFSLDSNGHLNGVRILRHSSDYILDKEVMRAIRKAAPFPPFPDSLRVSRLNIRAKFAYRLTSSR